MTGKHSYARNVTAPATTRVSTYSRYVGRVGALAAALGIGMMIATSPGMAAADSTNTGSSSSGASAGTGTDGSGGSSNAGTSGGETGSGATTNADTSSTTATGAVDSTSTGDGSTSPGDGGTAGGATTTNSATTATGESSDADAVLSGGQTPAGSSGSTPAAGMTDPTPPSSSAATPPPEPQLPASNTAEAESNSSRPSKAAPEMRSLATTTTTASTMTEDDGDTTPVQSFAADTASGSTLRTFATDTGGSALATSAVTALVAPVTPQIAAPVASVVGFLNSIVTTLLNPFLAPAPATGDPITPVVWAVLGWVRRNLFNQSPTISYNPTSTSQDGQTVTGDIGASDPEGDALTYTVTQEPEHGTVTIDQATGVFTYTPDDINYTAAQTDTFSVTVTDGKFNVLSLFSPHSAQADIDVTVLNPTVQRVILDVPGDIKSPANPRYSDDGKSIFFAGQPSAGGRSEIYQIDVDSSAVTCVTCGVTPGETGNLAKPVPVNDGSGRVLVLVNVPNQPPRYSMLEKDANGDPQLVRIETTDGGGLSGIPTLPPGGIIDRQREMRISPDGTHALYTRIVVGQTGGLQALPIVGTLTRDGDHYVVTDAKVVYPTGEGKQWTPDGKGVVILGGQFDAGNVDDIEVDLATGKVTRVTASLDYDEDMDYSPNEQWIAIGSTRGFEALTPMTRIVRQNFLPVYVGAAVYKQYAEPINVSNQEWAVAVGDELNRENGIPLFDGNDGYAARSMPSWNPTGDAVTFWESSVTDPTQSRLVIANLKYTTSVGPVGDETTVVSQTAFPDLGTYVAKTTPLPGTGTYSGAQGGTAEVTEVRDALGNTTRTVKYTNYVNEDGLVLNGTESADYGASQNTVHYLADVDVTDGTGADRGYLVADATVNAFSQSVTGYITSSLDNDIETIPDLDQAHAAQQTA